MSEGMLLRVSGFGGKCDDLEVLLKALLSLLLQRLQRVLLPLPPVGWCVQGFVISCISWDLMTGVIRLITFRADIISARWTTCFSV